MVYRVEVVVAVHVCACGALFLSVKPGLTERRLG